MHNIRIISNTASIELRLRSTELMELQGLCLEKGNERGLREFIKSDVCSCHHKIRLNRVFGKACLQKVKIYGKSWR